MTQRINKERLMKANKNYFGISHDVANAFPSPAHDRMDLMVEKKVKTESRLMKQRYRRARVILRGADGQKRPVKLGYGATQGDTTSPEMFIATYDVPITQWERESQVTTKGKMFNVTDPITHKVVSTGLTTFADDAFRANGLQQSPEEMKERVKQNDIQFDRALEIDEMGQNTDKKDVLPRFVGKGAQAAMQEVLGWGDKDPIMGKVKKAVKYLGSWLTCEINDSRYETSDRLTVMQIAWSRMNGFWGSSEVGLRTKKMVFNSMLTSAAVSGRTALNPHQSDNDRLEKRRMRYARTFLGKHGYKHEFPPIEDKEDEKSSTGASTHSSLEWVKHATNTPESAQYQCYECVRLYHSQCPDPQCLKKYCLIHTKRREECGHNSCPEHEYCTVCKHEIPERNLAEWPQGLIGDNAWMPCETPFHTPQSHTPLTTPRSEHIPPIRRAANFDDWDDIEMEFEDAMEYPQEIPQALPTWTLPPIPSNWTRIRYYTDGSCPENKCARRRPVPAGWGCTQMGVDPISEEEIPILDMHGPVNCEPGPRWLGAEKGSNNTGKLSGVGEAIWYALMYGNREIIHEIRTDSQYTIDVLNHKHAANSNRIMIRYLQRLHKLAKRHLKIEITKVEGHSGNEGNERADALAALGAEGYATALGRWTDAIVPHLGGPGFSTNLITEGPGKTKYEEIRKTGAPVRLERPTEENRIKTSIIAVRRRRQGGFGFKYKRSPTGLLITSVKPGGAADHHNIQKHDIIIQIANHNVNMLTDEILTAKWKSRRLKFTVRSDDTDKYPEFSTGRPRGEIEDVEITLERPRRAWAARFEPRIPWGLFVENEQIGFRVTQLTADSFAVRAGIKVGDVITHIDSESTSNRTRASFTTKFNKNKIQLKIKRGTTRAEDEVLAVYRGPTMTSTESPNDQAAEDDDEDASPPELQHQKKEEGTPDDGPRGYLNAWQAKSNKEIRKLLRMHTIESECLIARINWLKQQAQQPQNYEQLRGAVFGQYPWENNPTLTPEGYVTQHANSFAQQWQNDLIMVLGKEYKGLYDPDLHETLKQIKVAKLRMWETTTENKKAKEKPPNPELPKLTLTSNQTNTDDNVCGLIYADGTTCDESFDSLKALRCHQSSKHKARNVYRARVVTKQCPYCDLVMKDTSNTMKHVQRSFEIGGCSLRKGGPATALTTPLIEIENVKCRMCEKTFPTQEEYHEHVRTDRECYPDTIPDHRPKNLSAEEIRKLRATGRQRSQKTLKVSKKPIVQRLQDEDVGGGLLGRRLGRGGGGRGERHLCEWNGEEEEEGRSNSSAYADHGEAEEGRGGEDHHRGTEESCEEEGGGGKGGQEVAAEIQGRGGPGAPELPGARGDQGNPLLCDNHSGRAQFRESGVGNGEEIQRAGESAREEARPEIPALAHLPGLVQNPTTANGSQPGRGRHNRELPGQGQGGGRIVNRQFGESGEGREVYEDLGRAVPNPVQRLPGDGHGEGSTNHDVRAGVRRRRNQVQRGSEEAAGTANRDAPQESDRADGVMRESETDVSPIFLDALPQEENFGEGRNERGIPRRNANRTGQHEDIEMSM